MSNLIDASMDFARKIHRMDEYLHHPYEKHLSDVYRVAKRFEFTDHEILAACWLHDVVDKSEVNLTNLKYRFGDEVFSILTALKINPQLPLKEARRDKLSRINQNPGATIVFLCEFISELEMAKKEDRNRYHTLHKDIPQMIKALPNAPERLSQYLNKHQ